MTFYFFIVITDVDYYDRENNDLPGRYSTQQSIDNCFFVRWLAVLRRYLVNLGEKSHPILY
jgi:hypothetical protein